MHEKIPPAIFVMSVLNSTDILFLPHSRNRCANDRCSQQSAFLCFIASTIRLQQNCELIYLFCDRSWSDRTNCVNTFFY
jgi:hypothetical protein